MSLLLQAAMSEFDLAEMEMDAFKDIVTPEIECKLNDLALALRVNFLKTYQESLTRIITRELMEMDIKDFLAMENISL